jgi:hypothetical protein
VSLRAVGGAGDQRVLTDCLHPQRTVRSQLFYQYHANCDISDCMNTSADDSDYSTASVNLD